MVFVDTLAGENLTLFAEDTSQRERQDIAEGLLTYYVCVLIITRQATCYCFGRLVSVCLSVCPSVSLQCDNC